MIPWYHWLILSIGIIGCVHLIITIIKEIGLYIKYQYREYQHSLDLTHLNVIIRDLQKEIYGLKMDIEFNKSLPEIMKLHEEDKKGEK